MACIAPARLEVSCWHCLHLPLVQAGLLLMVEQAFNANCRQLDGSLCWRRLQSARGHPCFPGWAGLASHAPA